MRGGWRIVTNNAPSESTRGGVHNADSGLGNTGAQRDTRGLRRAPADSLRGRRSRHRASMFRNRGESVRTINLIYSDGSNATISQPGHLNTTTHMTVLKALEQRATRYRVKGKLLEVETRSHSWGLDDTGTIDTTCLQSREEKQQQERLIPGEYQTKSYKYTEYCQGARRRGLQD